MSEERFWNTDETISTAKFAVPDGVMTMRQAGRVFRLEPAPPKVEDINDCIISAVRENDLTYFTYFLHHYESRLNKRVYRFLLTEGIDRYDPLRFLDYKLSCVLAMLECLQNYIPDKGADFLTYAHHFIGNALLDCRRQEEAGSFKSLDEYKAARGIAWLYNNSGKSEKEIIAEYANQQNCTEETAAVYLTLARQNRNRVPFYANMQNEDSEETGEDVTGDDSWNYADILWNGIRADTVQAAFDKLSHMEKFFLEKRNGDFFRNVEVVIADIFKVNKIYRLGGLFNGLFDLGPIFQQAVNLFVGMVQTLLQIGGGLNQGIHCIGCKLFGVALLQ